MMYQESFNNVSTKYWYQQSINKYFILIIGLNAIYYIYNVYEWIIDSLIDKLIGLMIGLIIFELEIVIIDRIDGIIVYNGNGMATPECGFLELLYLFKNYNCGCLIIFCNYRYNLSCIWLIGKWIEVNL